jgi:hypothetical protein
MLSKEILEETHTSEEYLSWVKSLVASVRSNAGGIEKIRFRKKLAKNLMEEALPLGYLAENYFNRSNKVAISLVVGNQPYDAIVNDLREDDPTTYHVEITLAHEGENEHLRMLALHQNGHVSGVGKVSKTGTKKTGLRVEVQAKTVSQNEVIKRETKLIQDAIERKIKKNYPENIMLLIGFDDIMAFDREDNITNIENVIDRYINSSSKFSKIVVVGLHNDLCIERCPK